MLMILPVPSLPSTAIILLHILLAFADALPAHKITFYILCHVIYL